MSSRFSKKPGRHERHLQRKDKNRLFAKNARNVSDEAIAQARERDNQELLAFSKAYQEILQTIGELSGNVDTQVILDIKERIDRLYEQVCGLAGDRSEEKQGLIKLHHAITQAIRDAAEGDVEAIARLDEEARAREIHLQLLQHPIIADLLYPDTPIMPDELLPSLLSEDANSFATAMGIFNDEQRKLLLTQARALLAGCDDERELDDARARLRVLEDLAGNTRTAH